MLLIAMPKAAGTSLVVTLGKILDIPVCEGTKDTKNNLKCKGFSEIQKYHTIMGRRSYLFFDKVTKSRFDIYREHILPTNHHLHCLKKLNRKIMILVRDPEDITDCYRRMKKSSKMNIKKIKQEMEHFLFQYYKFLDTYKKAFVITYGQLVLNYSETIRKILRFYELGYKIPKRIPALSKRHYTGVGKKRLKGNK